MRAPLVRHPYARDWRRAFAALLGVCLLSFASALAARAEAPPARAETVLRVGFTVRDLDASLRFFTEVLGFEDRKSVV